MARPLSPRALHLLREVAAGRDRIYAADAAPPGVAMLMQRGYLVRLGSERAQITPTGRAFLDGIDQALAVAETLITAAQER